jgi:glycosyltransferase involved in cell wall biosynthesis
MRISIITPSFNQGEFIEETIQSVVNQNYDDVEHIVVDGGSTDDTIQKLKRHPHLKWVSEKDSGQSNAINKGFRMATGDILAWLNSDDYYEKDIFGEIARYFETDPACVFVYGDMTFVDREGRPLSRVTGDTLNYENLIACPDIVRQPSCFWRRTVVEECGGLDETLDLVMDFDFFLRVARRFRLHYLSRNLSYYRYYAENKSLSLVRRQVSEIFRVYRKNDVALNASSVKFLAAKYIRSFDARKIRKGSKSLKGDDIGRGTRKTVLFVDDCTGRTGSTVSMEYLVRGFKSRGYTVYVLTSKTDPNVMSLLESSATLLDARKWGMKTIALDLHFTRTLSPFSKGGFVIIMKNVAKLFLGIAVVWKEIKDTRADIVYANEYVVVQSSIAAVLRGVPSVMHIRSRFLRGSIGVRRWMLSRLIPSMNKAVFAITKIEAMQLRPRKSHCERVSVLGEFFSRRDAETIDSNEARKVFGFPNGQRIVSMLGGVLEIKGTIDFLRAADRVAQERHDVLFVLAGKSNWIEGDGGREYFEACMENIEALRRRNAISVLGEISNSLELIASSDIVVSPSQVTHFPRPVIEAWGFSKPVIAVRTDHTENLITDNVDGLLVKKGSDEDLARSILLLLQDAEMCKRLGMQGRQRTHSEFDAETNVGTIVDICDSLINQKWIEHEN